MFGRYISSRQVMILLIRVVIVAVGLGGCVIFFLLVIEKYNDLTVGYGRLMTTCTSLLIVLQESYYY